MSNDLRYCERCSDTLDRLRHLPTNGGQMKLKVLLIAALLAGPRWAFAFNLWTDIQQQTTFPIGQAASAGTAVNLKTGNLSASALAELSNYRMFSLWYGGTMIDPANGQLTDTAKVGINVGYFLTGFVNEPPLILRNLVVGPSIAMSLISTPRVVTYLFDANYKFGYDTALPPAVTPKPVSN